MIQKLFVIFSLVCVLTACFPNRSTPEVVDARAITGIYSGTYKCAQGQTGLDLEIRGLESGRVEAVFSFFAIASNPNVPAGKFRMLGAFYNTGRLVLQAKDATDWISRPSTYSVVSLDGTINANNAVFSGSVPECGTQFVLQRR